MVIDKPKLSMEKAQQVSMLLLEEARKAIDEAVDWMWGTLDDQVALVRSAAEDGVSLYEVIRGLRKAPTFFDNGEAVAVLECALADIELANTADDENGRA